MLPTPPPVSSLPLHPNSRHHQERSLDGHSEDVLRYLMDMTVWRSSRLGARFIELVTFDLRNSLSL
ncbi:hypothetical protein Bpfe_016076, partial [Biomphalaria pfeifferi]